jgi:hypothetical protein
MLFVHSCLNTICIFCSNLFMITFRKEDSLTYFVISAEQPYDSIPNFSAADALRITGVGRNEFIGIMNKCRSKVLLSTMSWPFSNVAGPCILDVLVLSVKHGEYLSIIAMCSYVGMDGEHIIIVKEV